MVEVDETIDSIAVLPFENLSGDPEQEYLADGITESLIYDLSKIKSVKVISRTSVMLYKDMNKSLKEIANELGVTAVVEGSMRCFGNKVEISAKLIDTRDEKNIWGKQYVRAMEDILKIQNEIAYSIATEVSWEITLLEKESILKRQEINPMAYENYLEGLQYPATQGGLKKGLEYMLTAVEHDPDFAQAYAMIAYNYYLQFNYHLLPPQKAIEKARENANKALGLDSTLTEAYIVLGWIMYEYDWKIVEAETFFKKAVRNNPNSADAHGGYGFYLGSVGRFDVGILSVKKAQELDPLNLSFINTEGWLYDFSGQYELGINRFQKILSSDSTWYTAYWGLGRAYYQKSMYEKSVHELKEALKFSGRQPKVIQDLAFVYSKIGDRDLALNLLDELKRRKKKEYISPGTIAKIYMGLGEMDQAYLWMKKAFDERVVEVMEFYKDKRYHSIFSDQRFVELYENAGLDLPLY